MIGNDIIDLNVAKINSRWQEQRFLNKIFTEEEQTYILNGNFRYQTIWRLWSMKESAYKIMCRNTNRSALNPKSFKCEISSRTFGTVFCDHFKINTITEYDSNIIYTTGFSSNSCSVSNCFELKQQSQSDRSKEIREIAIHAFAKFTSVSKDSISIKTDHSGIPHILIHQKLQSAHLTLTHHGRYGGVAISLC